MESVLKRAILRGEQQQECDVLQAIREVCRQLDSVQARFEMGSDSPVPVFASAGQAGGAHRLRQHTAVG